MRNWVIKKLGGYTSIEDAIADIDSKDNKHTILTKAVAHLFNTIGDNDILKYEKGQWLYQGRVLDELEINQIKAEAMAFEKFRLYEILNAEIKYHAAYKMYYKSQSVDDLVAAKMIEYVWDIIKTKLSKLK